MALELDLACPILKQTRTVDGFDVYYYGQSPNSEAGWGTDSVLCYAYGEQRSSTVPIYEHKFGDRPLYYYDRQEQNDYDWSRGEVAFWAYDQPIRCTVPLYVHRYRDQPNYYYDLSQENDFGWSRGEVLCHVIDPRLIAEWEAYRRKPSGGRVSYGYGFSVVDEPFGFSPYLEAGERGELKVLDGAGSNSSGHLEGINGFYIGRPGSSSSSWQPLPIGELARLTPRFGVKAEAVVAGIRIGVVRYEWVTGVGRPGYMLSLLGDPFDVSYDDRFGQSSKLFQLRRDGTTDVSGYLDGIECFYIGRPGAAREGVRLSVDDLTQRTPEIDVMAETVLGGIRLGLKRLDW